MCQRAKLLTLHYLRKDAERTQMSKNKKSIFDDGFHAYLTEGASCNNDPGIPELMQLSGVPIPKGLISFQKAKSTKDPKDFRKFIHFYMHDKGFNDVLTATTVYLDLFKQFDGVITPDCSLLIGQSKCLQQTNTYFNRAVGFYIQKQGIPIIPNVRWSDRDSFEFCFIGIPKHYIVSISTHGCIRNKQEKTNFKLGLEAMLNTLEPRDVVVHGYMPDSVFSDYLENSNFHRFPNHFEEKCRNKEAS